MIRCLLSWAWTRGKIRGNEHRVLDTQRRHARRTKHAAPFGRRQQTRVCLSFRNTRTKRQNTPPRTSPFLAGMEVLLQYMQPIVPHLRGRRQVQQALQDVLEVFHGAPRLDRQYALPGVDLAIQGLRQEGCHGGSSPKHAKIAPNIRGPPDYDHGMNIVRITTSRISVRLERALVGGLSWALHDVWL